MRLAIVTFGTKSQLIIFCEMPRHVFCVPAGQQQNFGSSSNTSFRSYAERREYIWNEFRPLFERLEGSSAAPSDHSVSVTLEKFDTETIHQVWLKALERRESDPEGAITLARTLLESVCKHILEQHSVSYKMDGDLPDLYKATAKVLNIAPSQHSEQIFKQILGGCTAVVEGLGALRNRLSDAHGQGKKQVKNPHPDMLNLLSIWQGLWQPS